MVQVQMWSKYCIWDTISNKILEMAGYKHLISED